MCLRIKYDISGTGNDSDSGNRIIGGRVCALPPCPSRPFSFGWYTTLFEEEEHYLFICFLFNSSLLILVTNFNLITFLCFFVIIYIILFFLPKIKLKYILIFKLIHQAEIYDILGEPASFALGRNWKWGVYWHIASGEINN